MQFKGLRASIELSTVLEEAQDIAAQSGLELGSCHLLLALFTVENRAKSILEDHGLTIDGVIDEVVSLEPEPVDTISVIHAKAAKISESCGGDMVGSLHLMAALCRVARSQAYQAVQGLGVRPSLLRTTAISRLTGGMKRHYLYPTAAPHADRVEAGRRAIAEREEPHKEPARTPVAVAEPEVEPEERRPPRQPSGFLELPQRRPDTSPPVERRPEQAMVSRYDLDADTFPVLRALGRNLTLLAEEGTLDPLIGRAREVEQLVDILNKRRANNPCLVGDPGVGKTAIVEGLAQRIVAKDSQVGALGDKVLIELEMGGLLAGTQLRGAFAERLRAIKDEVAQADGRIVLFIDELHTIIGAGSGDGSLDAANELKTALARGEFPCVGSTTEREYRRHVESDAALERRFQPVLVDEPSPEESLKVLQGLEGHYSAHHKVRYRVAAMEAAVQLSSRWIHDRFLPAKAIDVLDLAGAWASRHNKGFVTAPDVAKVVAQHAGIPEERLLVSDAERLLTMESHMNERLIAHEEAVTRISRVVRRNFAGFTTGRPMGSFLLLGPTGVGKTECARVLADFLFGSRDAMTRLDMSEYMDDHSLSRLIGAPPGYIGHDDGGQLTEAVRRRPYQILLFDEVEKASKKVLNVLLQLLEEGQLTDGRGRRVRFQHVVVMMTSNLGDDRLDGRVRRVGFGAAPSDEDRSAGAIASARKAFTPELWNRIEEKLVFHRLNPSDIERIARLLLASSADRLQAETKIRYEVTDDVVPLLVERGGYEPSQGARPMRRVIQDLVEGAVAEAILTRRAVAGDTVVVGVVDDKVAVVE